MTGSWKSSNHSSALEPWTPCYLLNLDGQEGLFAYEPQSHELFHLFATKFPKLKFQEMLILFQDSGTGIQVPGILKTISI